ncbi:receptor protein kinase TMK1-like [Cucurbita pepo subsp. pepo]|uniref:receptor protein kinase TMK1-like n=1 Tax=Cucurbita pepo subsp. pepo TaxID=3664 RepID=UPI000C9D68A9|nr:receptor protein kinase TMK1-like [Cucurbita pepo subsp. pepo]
MEMMDYNLGLCISLVLLCTSTVCFCATDLSDVKILNDLRMGLENPELLKWPDNGDDPCGIPPWPHVYCAGDRVSQIQVQGLGLKGPLPQNLNQLSKLSNLGLQKNKFNGALPSFSGLSELEFAYLDFNEFDTIPLDFFNGLTNIRVLALDYNPFNATAGWSLPDELAKSVQLTNLSLVHSNLVGPVPEFLGTLPSLTALKLSYNRLTGPIPESFGQSLMQILWLNDQDTGMTGSIDVVPLMTSLTQLWLHGNKFSGVIPENIGELAALSDLNLNRNQLVGPVPESLAKMNLDNLVLNNNFLMGPIPEFEARNVTYDYNYFCQSKPGLQCAPEVTALLYFLGSLNYPIRLASEWSGNDPCQGPWLGLSCNPESKVSMINLPKRGLLGTLSPSISNLDSLIEIRLAGNNISGIVPQNFTSLKSLRLLDLTGNNFEPPLPKFRDDVKVLTLGNPFLVSNHSAVPPLPITHPPLTSVSPPLDDPSGDASSRSPVPGSPITVRNSSSSVHVETEMQKSSKTRRIMYVVATVLIIVMIFLSALFCIFCFRRRKRAAESPTFVVHPKDPSYPESIVKISVSNKNTGNVSNQTGTSMTSTNSGGTESSHVIEDGNLVVAVQVLRKVTNNFSLENELGRGGFGTVYKGELEDGTKIAVKRMEAGSISNKALEEFQSEIAVLSHVRHRHLVSLLGYSIEGAERLLVYEYMSQGALSKHLFHWKSFKLEPLPWMTRLTIALDVARGIEYLHGLARQTFIHRDLKSSNILLDDDFRAKVSDFGLVKLAPDGEKSVATKLAGTFGYLAPEYAVMGKITTKADVFSFGVVLMELLTGMMALDEERPEESRYLAEWFWRIKSNKEKLMCAIDPSLSVNAEVFEKVFIIAELAGHCTAREPTHRPDMGHVVNVLSPLIEKWKPIDDDADSMSGIDYSLPLPEMLKVWQEAESGETKFRSLEDSKGSIPARPTGFADSFTSVDGR